jgi:hypothetical protein
MDQRLACPATKPSGSSFSNVHTAMKQAPGKEVLARPEAVHERSAKDLVHRASDFGLTICQLCVKLKLLWDGAAGRPVCPFLHESVGSL